MLGSSPRGLSSLNRGNVDDVGISSGSYGIYISISSESNGGNECLHKFFEEHPDTLAAQGWESQSTEEVMV